MKVLIAGGGIAGLSAAIGLLQKHHESISVDDDDDTKQNQTMSTDLEIIIFEKDISKDARIQGYGLAISPQGASALNEFGLVEDLLPHCKHGGTNFWVGRSSGSNFVHGGKSDEDDDDNDTGKYNGIDDCNEDEKKKVAFMEGKMIINRGILRERMLEEIEKYKDIATIRWNSKIECLKVTREATNDEDTKKMHNRNESTSSVAIVEVTLQDGGETIIGDVLLGCDGIFSQVRELLPKCIVPEPVDKSFPTNPPLRHLGVAWVRGVCREEGQFKHWINDGSFTVSMADPDGCVFLAECDKTGGDVCWFLGFPMSNPVEDAQDGIVASTKRIDDRQQIADLITEKMKKSNWHPSAKRIIDGTVADNDRPLLFRHLYDRSETDVEGWNVPEPWVPITLLGDAFHPVASYAFAGCGSNAMADGIALAKALIPDNVDDSSKNDDFTKDGKRPSIAELLRLYEEPIRQRSIPQAKKSKKNTSLIHSGWLGGYVAQIVAYVATSCLWLFGVSL